MKTMSQRSRGMACHAPTGRTGLPFREIVLGILFALLGWVFYIGLYETFVSFCAGGD